MAAQKQDTGAPDDPHNSTNGDGKQGPAPKKRSAKVTTLIPRDFPRTSFLVAEYIYRQHGGDIRWCNQEARWYVWTGNIWKREIDEHGTAYIVARNALKNLGKMALAIEDDAQRTACLEIAAKYQNERAVKSVMTDLKALVSVSAEDFDNNPWLLTVKNGTIDLRTGKLRKASREDYITKEAPVTFDPAAKCPQWEDFIAWRCKNSPGFMTYSQRLDGACLTGITRDQAFFIDYGDGGNGKSMHWGAIRRLLGPYAITVAADTLMQNKEHSGGAPRADLMAMKGARLALTAEGDDGQRLAEGLVKLLTGGDAITVRSPYGRDQVEFEVTHKLVLFTNHRPVISGSDSGIWRRVHLIPSEASIEDDVRAGRRKRVDLVPIFDNDTERSGILNWLIAGCLIWQKQGIGTCREVEYATKAYKREMDLIGEFLMEYLPTKTSKLELLVKEVYGAYRAWADESGRGRFTLAKQRFDADLKRRGAVTSQGHARVTYWKGLDAILAVLEAEADEGVKDDATSSGVACPQCRQKIASDDIAENAVVTTGYCTTCNYAWVIARKGV